MRTRLAELLVAATGSLAVIAPACSGTSAGDDCPAGTEACPCRSDGTCDGELRCYSNLCVLPAADDTGGNGGVGEPAGVAGTAASGSGGEATGSGGEATGSGGEATGSGGETIGSGGEATGSGGIMPGTGGATSGSGGATGGSGGATGGSSGATSGSGGETSGSGGAMLGTGGTTIGTGGETCVGLPFDGTEPDPDCVGEAFETEMMPIDLYLMVDRTVSMLRDVAGMSNVPAPAGESRWDGITQALLEFATDPDVAEVGVGIQFFGADLLASEALNCDVSNYATPMVPIAPLSDSGLTVVAAVEAIGDQLGGLTPMLPALQGALQYAAGTAAESGRTTAVVLVVDGQPTQCQDPIVVSDIADEAARGLAEDDVRTFVIGVGPGLFNLHRIAESGGTGQAYLIEDGDAAAQFRDAITSIATTPLSCEFDLPEQPDPTLQVDPNEVQVVFYPLDGDPEELPRHATGATCVNSPYGGWYFDNASSPETIHICPCNCNRLGTGRLEVRFGCAPRVFDDS